MFACIHIYSRVKSFRLFRFAPLCRRTFTLIRFIFSHTFKLVQPGFTYLTKIVIFYYIRWGRIYANDCYNTVEAMLLICDDTLSPIIFQNQTSSLLTNFLGIITEVYSNAGNNKKNIQFRWCIPPNPKIYSKNFFYVFRFSCCCS